MDFSEWSCRCNVLRHILVSSALSSWTKEFCVKQQSAALNLKAVTTQLPLTLALPSFFLCLHVTNITCTSVVGMELTVTVFCLQSWQWVGEESQLYHATYNTLLKIMLFMNVNWQLQKCVRETMTLPSITASETSPKNQNGGKLNKLLKRVWIIISFCHSPWPCDDATTHVWFHGWNSNLQSITTMPFITDFSRFNNLVS